MAAQIKIGVVCHVHRSIPVTGDRIKDIHGIFLCQSVFYGDLQLSGKSLVAVGTVQKEYHGILSHFPGGPQSPVIIIGTAVEVVLSLIFSQDIGSSI